MPGSVPFSFTRVRTWRRRQFVDPAGIVHEGDESRLGEAWLRGAIILSWDDVRRDAGDFQDGHNVTLHEFAHQLDQQDGTFDGAPLLERRSHYRSWARILMKEYRALGKAAERGQDDADRSVWCD